MSENNYPHLCREVGLGCRECVQQVAEQTARLCTGLRGKAIGQMFVNLYPNPACSSMHAEFEATYLHRQRLDTQRKGPASETLPPPAWVKSIFILFRLATYKSRRSRRP